MIQVTILIENRVAQTVDGHVVPGDRDNGGDGIGAGAHLDINGAAYNRVRHFDSSPQSLERLPGCAGVCVIEPLLLSVH